MPERRDGDARLTPGKAVMSLGRLVRALPEADADAGEDLCRGGQDVLFVPIYYRSGRQTGCLRGFEQPLYSPRRRAGETRAF
jgi:hypothetical protein